MVPNVADLYATDSPEVNTPRRYAVCLTEYAGGGAESAVCLTEYAGGGAESAVCLTEYAGGGAESAVCLIRYAGGAGKPAANAAELRINIDKQQVDASR